MRYFVHTDKPISTNFWCLGWQYDEGTVWTITISGHLVKWAEPESGLWRLVEQRQAVEVASFEVLLETSETLK